MKSRIFTKVIHTKYKIYSNNGVSIESVGSKNPDELYRHLIRNTKDKQYGLVFMKSCVSKITKIKIRPAAIEYINTFNH